MYKAEYQGGQRAYNDFGVDHIYYKILIKRLCYGLFYVFVLFAIINVAVCRRMYNSLKSVLDSCNES